MNELLDIITKAVKREEKTKPYDTVAKVTRVDGDTAWVHIDGGVAETPVKMTINASEGDNVQVRVSGGTAFLIGNATAPPTDDTTAVYAVNTAVNAQYDAARAFSAAESAEQDATRAFVAAENAERDATRARESANAAEEHAQEALTSAQSAQRSADSALLSLSTVEDVVDVLNWITTHGTMTANGSTALDPSKVYFIVDANGDYVVGGTHYSIVTEPKAEDRTSYYTLSVDESIQNYIATHLVVDAEGLWLIPDAGGNKVLIATGAGNSYTVAGTYIIGKVNGLDTVFAKFTQNGTNMSAENGTQIAHLGYGEAKTETGTGNNPYYTLGERGTATRAYSSASTYRVGDLCLHNGKQYVCKIAITTPESFTSSHWQLAVGGYSVVEGIDGQTTDAGVTTISPISASGYASHAEGLATSAIGNFSHAEGRDSKAVGYASHAEGMSYANGEYAHAEGYYTYANGQASHTSGSRTIAGYTDQTAIGRYNDNKSSNLFEIGNGTANNARLNVFEVDSSGNVNIASGASYKINGVAIPTDATATPTANKAAKFDASAKMNSSDMSSSDVADFVEALNVTGINAVDYVVACNVTSDGGYIKYNSGIMVCWQKTSDSVAINGAYGSLFSGTYNWYYPQTFLSAPVVTVGQMKWGTGASWGQCDTSTTTYAILRAIDIASRASGTTSIQAMAIGRWK